jgi:hypothetical protein
MDSISTHRSHVRMLAVGALIVAAVIALVARSGAEAGAAAPGADAAFPDRVVEELRSRGVDTAAARLALTTASGSRVYEAPGQGVVCAIVVRAVADDVGAGCAVPESLRDGSFTTTTSTGPGSVVTVAGLVASGTRSVAFRFSNGRTEVADVVGGAYAYEGVHPPSEIEVVDAGGTTRRFPVAAGQG